MFKNEKILILRALGSISTTSTIGLASYQQVKSSPYGNIFHIARSRSWIKWLDVFLVDSFFY